VTCGRRHEPTAIDLDFPMDFIDSIQGFGYGPAGERVVVR
jgi:hypothetical protein